MKTTKPSRKNLFIKFEDYMSIKLNNLYYLQDEKYILELIKDLGYEKEFVTFCDYAESPQALKEINIQDKTKLVHFCTNWAKDIQAPELSIEDREQFLTFKRKKDIFRRQNASKSYISIDLVKANFQAVNLLTSKKIHSWEHLCEYLEINFYYKDSTKERQQLFSKIGQTSCIKKTQEYMVSLILKEVLKEDFNPDGIQVNLDEVLIEIPSDYPSKDFNAFKERLEFNLSLDIKVNRFKLDYIMDVHNRYNFFKTSRNGLKLKGVKLPLYNAVNALVRGENIPESFWMFFDKAQDKLVKTNNPFMGKLKLLKGNR